MHAARNIALCTKDCLCLFICPTGATDTETGQIDFEKCIDGCRLCVDACPSHALYLVFDRYPEKEQKSHSLGSALASVAENKVTQEAICKALEQKGGPGEKLAKALAVSNRILAEDCTRESNYMLPQTEHVQVLLAELAERKAEKDFPYEAVEYLQKEYS
jgi:NAD-dependent dihydropyrimidine dehydrogenase PreA subunit